MTPGQFVTNKSGVGRQRVFIFVTTVFKQSFGSTRPVNIVQCACLLCRIGVFAAGVYTQAYRECGELLYSMASVDHAAWTRARETVHIYQGT